MKIGDLVLDLQPEYKGEVGIIIEVDEWERGVYHVMFPNGREWVDDGYLELISESR